MRASNASPAELQTRIDEREAELRSAESRAAAFDAMRADLYVAYQDAVGRHRPDSGELWSAFQRAQNEAARARRRTSSLRYDLLRLQWRLAEFRRAAGPPDPLINYAPFHSDGEELVPEGPRVVGRTCLRCGQPLADMRDTFCSRRCAARFRAEERAFDN